MWEHAEAIVHIPEAIKATIEIIEHFRSGFSIQRAGEARANLDRISQALDGFAIDAQELFAYKQLHSITNQFEIDLKTTFAMIGPDDRHSHRHHSESLDTIRLEFQSIQMGPRAANQLAELRDTPRLMRHLQNLPEDVLERIPTPPWDRYFWTLLQAAKAECDNYRNFYAKVFEFHELNTLLNNFADRNIKRGINEFDELMDKLRTALVRA